jgi:Domain of unknown function (DUF6968)
MLIATRILRLRRAADDVEIPVRIFAPEQRTGSWFCKFEVGWPDGPWAMAAGGVDAVQALELALKMIGAQIYASDHHTAGRLVWLEPGRGYGFPVPSGIRDLLVARRSGLVTFGAAPTEGNMDIELAREVVRAAFRSSAELQALLPVLKRQCDEEEYRSYALGIASAIDAIGVGLTNKALAAQPALAGEIESSLQRQERF